MKNSPAFWILVASFLFATMSALVKVASEDVSLPAIVFFRTLPATIFLLAFARARRLPVISDRWRLHLSRSVIGVGSMVSGFYAISALPLATASTLEYTAPLFMMAYMLILARQHLTVPMAGAMGIGFAGVLLLLQPTLETGKSLPFVAGLASGGLAAAAYWQIRRLGKAGEPEWRIVLLYSIAALLVGLVGIPFARPSEFNVRSVVALLGVGVIGLFAQLAMTRAFSRGSTPLLATLQYSTVVFSALFGLLFWRDGPGPLGMLGLSFVVLAGVASIRIGSRLAPTA